LRFAKLSNLLAVIVEQAALGGQPNSLLGIADDAVDLQRGQRLEATWRVDQPSSSTASPKRVPNQTRASTARSEQALGGAGR
jgi:hypothetical protein